MIKNLVGFGKKKPETKLKPWKRLAGINNILEYTSSSN